MCGNCLIDLILLKALYSIYFYYGLRNKKNGNEMTSECDWTRRNSNINMSLTILCDRIVFTFTHLKHCSDWKVLNLFSFLPVLSMSPDLFILVRQKFNQITTTTTEKSNWNTLKKELKIIWRERELVVWSHLKPQTPYTSRSYREKWE